ncbi:hypothetical protein DQ819_26400, partial [Salmonella enterica subsp. enterica serovar Mikawasima]|nr:hypothetical protein [Salmonella enterica subsp. enterica serovar Mikawasima]
KNKRKIQLPVVYTATRRDAAPTFSLRREFICHLCALRAGLQKKCNLLSAIKSLMNPFRKGQQDRWNTALLAF